MATVPDEARVEERPEEPERRPRRRFPIPRRRRPVEPDAEPLTSETPEPTVPDVPVETPAPEPPEAEPREAASSTPPPASGPPGEPAGADPEVPAVVVPVVEPSPAAPGPVLARRERRRRRASRRRWALTVPGVLAVLVVIAVVGAQLRSGAPASRRAAAHPASLAVTGRVPTLLLAHVAGDGRIDLAALVGVTKSRRDGSILLIPTLTQAETPSLDLQLLSDLRMLGSTALFQTTVENLLGVRIDGTEVFDDARLADALRAVGPLTVDLNGEVEVGQGDQVRSFPSGPQTITPADALALLTQRPGTDEIDHLVTVQAVFEGWLSALRTGPGAAATQTRFPLLRSLVAAARAATTFSDVPVDTISTGPGERYQVREDALPSAMQQAFPEDLLGIGGRRLRTEILNGTGVVGLVPQVARVAVPAGAVVLTTGNASQFGVATTQVIYYRDADRAAAEQLLRALGTGRLLKATNDLKVFDVTIIAGADFPPPRTR